MGVIPGADNAETHTGMPLWLQERSKVGSKVLGEGGFHKKKAGSNPCLVVAYLNSGLELDYGKLTVAVSPGPTSAASTGLSASKA